MSQEKYISLREAAEISGYSADYIGQLIRKGKLPGKQVFSNVAWMTTEDAVEVYMHDNTKSVASFEDSPVTLFLERMMSTEQLTLTYRAVAWFAIVFLVMFVLFLVSVIAVTLDHRIDREYQDRINHINSLQSSP